ncbi:hypothetical protein C7C46_26405 [Streptomyces tateyamensis]|uniref:Uncharacterized protein n=1 Tax=Streptomyces tateyamensis TaxID=565073 RepID=A0A2V4NVR1_9ACTN|nr:hypothetical protein [Streptomyces tateyamensis]PYC71884.1 hypothetical protein C7C46_26405 [Streptomyces tateyamensis]
MTGTDETTVAVLELVAPLLTVDQLRERLAGAAGDPRFGVRVRDGWDGPQARITAAASAAAAGELERALGVEPPAAEAAGPRADAGFTGRAFAAWQELLRRCPEADRARYGFVLNAEPALPEGWLLLGWANPAFGAVQFTVRRYARLAVTSPGPAEQAELDLLLARWTALVRQAGDREALTAG